MQGCFDILLFKINLYAFFLQLPDGGKAVDRVTGKSADRLGHDKVQLNVVYDTK